jgi:hypothetical protein
MIPTKPNDITNQCLPEYKPQISIIYDHIYIYIEIEKFKINEYIFEIVSNN